jgi:GT2 family glycosyltransferase/glycosyltransferase involved in cell wall biosynthesis
MDNAAKQAFTAGCTLALRSFLASGARLRWEAVEEPVVSVVLVLFNRAELTLRCLRSIAEERRIPLEIIVVDNASTDETEALLERLDGVRVIRNAENRGFVLAVNQAARRARGRYLLLLNNDTELLPDALAAALAAIEGREDVGAVGGKVLTVDGRLQEAGSIVWSDGSCLGYGRGDSPFAAEYMFRRDVDFCSGAFLLTSRALFLACGGFDEDYQPAYYEEADYCLRLWEGGKRVVYEPRASLVHVEFASAASTEEAVRMQRERRETFARKRAESLRRRCPPLAANVLAARTAGERRLRVLFVDDRVPHAFLGAGFPRSRQMLLALEAAGHSVTFFPLSFPDEEWDAVYQDVPPTVEVMVGWGAERLEEFLRARSGYYDRILVSRPHNMQRLRAALNGHARNGAAPRVIYDAEAIFALREAGRHRLRGGEWRQGAFAAKVREEAALARPADAVIAVSEAERALFLEAGLPRVFVLGHAVAPAPTPRPFERRSGLLFVGAVHGDDDPNADALEWFATGVLPLLRDRLSGEARLRAVGVNLSPRLSALRSPGLELLGWVDDLTPIYDRARVFVAPLRYAAGIPLKVYDAASHGVPVVCTPLLARQLGWTPGEELLAAEEPSAFAEACLALYRDAELWRRIRAAALARVARDCSTEAFAGVLRHIVEAAGDG